MNGRSSEREREFQFTDRDFEKIRGLIHTHAGISLNSGKVDMVYSRIARRLRATGLYSFEEYLDRLSSDPEEWQNFVNSLTTNLTSFFREPHHFPILGEHVLRVRRKLGGPLVLWSSACSTGEEPYSMAMAVIDAFGSWTPPVKILATDLDTNVIRQAAEGVYPIDRVNKLPEDVVKRFFLRGTASRQGMVRVRGQVRDLVSFRQLNLLDDTWPIRGPLDAIFCRNVMIYFDKSTQYKILAKFHAVLRSDGLLFLGHSESMVHAADLFRLQGKTVSVPVIRT